MTPIIEAVGGTFDFERRYQKILDEKKNGSHFLSVLRNRKIVGYLEYAHDCDDVWKIQSIQIHPEHKGSMVIRDLLSLARQEVNKTKPKLIKSSVHVTNEASLKLHNRMGFQEVGSNDDRILFEVRGDKLLKILNRY